MEIDIIKILQIAIDYKASDIHIISGIPITYKVGDKHIAAEQYVMMPEDTKTAVEGLYTLAYKKTISDLNKGDDDFAVMIPNVGRFRVNVYWQRFSMAAVIRTVSFKIPNPAELNIPDTIINLANYKRGIVLITGTTGSGKSSTLACLIDKINNTKINHIITIEDPIEFRHDHKKSVISQREVGTDTESYSSALRAAMRQAPDVLLIGEMRDLDTIKTAISAAETGHLVFSTLHTMGAANTIDRIIDVFPPGQQNQIRIQLSITLQAVVSQQLLPCNDDIMRPAFEILIMNSAARNLVREGKSHQIDNVIQTNAALGMISMDTMILELLRRKHISRETALAYCVNRQDLLKRSGY